METEPALYFNPSCSKCRTADALLNEHGIEAALVRYLDRSPTTRELRRLMSLLVIDDPRAMMRTSEPVYDELGLGDASSDQSSWRRSTNIPSSWNDPSSSSATEPV